MSDDLDAYERQIDQLAQELEEAKSVIKQLQHCRRTCPTILRFAVSAKEILKDAPDYK